VLPRPLKTLPSLHTVIMRSAKLPSPPVIMRSAKLPSICHHEKRGARRNDLSRATPTMANTQNAVYTPDLSSGFQPSSRMAVLIGGLYDDIFCMAGNTRLTTNQTKASKTLMELKYSGLMFP